MRNCTHSLTSAQDKLSYMYTHARTRAFLEDSLSSRTATALGTEVLPGFKLLEGQVDKRNCLENFKATCACQPLSTVIGLYTSICMLVQIQA